MSARKRRPSLLGGLLWSGLGILFLVHNFGIGPDIWTLMARYWPILLILLGLGKVIDYYRQKDGVSVRIGEVFGILLVLIIGSAVSEIPNSAVGDFLYRPVRIGNVEVALGDSYSYTEESSYPIPSGIPLRIENADGLVSVSPGSDGEVRIRLHKVVINNEESKARDIASEIQIETETEGEGDSAVFVVRTNRDALASRDYRFSTDMEIQVPKRSALQVRNSSGEVTVSNLDGRMDLQTSHKSLDLRDCSGQFLVSNRYGETRLANLTGNTTVDSRGDVHVEGVQGNVEIRDEYSAIDIRNVQGRVSAVNREGTINIQDVTEPVTIDALGSEVTVSDLSDTLKVDSSHRRVRISDVDSNILLTSRYGTIVMNQIKGNVDIDSNSDRISLDDLGGYLKVTGQGSSLRARTIKGPVNVVTTLKDVKVDDFIAGCNVTNEYGDVVLTPGNLDGQQISVRNRNGDISVFLPASAGFQIDATVRNGRLTSDFIGLEPDYTNDHTALLKGSFRGGGARITLETEYSDIHVRSREAESARGGAK